MRDTRLVCLPILLAVLLAMPAVADDWMRFRGANGDGMSSSENLPTEFGPETNTLWVTDVPFGRSSPIVAGNRIFLTAIEDGAFVTMALDRSNGKTLWKSSVQPLREDTHHHDTDSATTTPVTDGKNVYVFFQEFGLVSYDKRGKERWTYAMGPFRNFYGIAASPILNGNLLYMVCDQVEGSFLLALDTKNGKEIWRRNRPGRLESYTTPILYPDATAPEALLVFGSSWIDAYDPKTGEALWEIGEVGVGPISSPVLVGNTLYVASPSHGESGWSEFAAIAEEHDKDGNGEITRKEVAEAWLIRHFGWLDRDGNDVITETDWITLGKEVTKEHWGAFAIRLGGEKPERLWNYRKNVSEIATPLVHDGIFYMAEKGILTSLDATTGEMIKRDRIGEGSPKVYASPVAADGRIYLGTLDGTMAVVSAVGDWEILTSVDLGEEIWATPAITDDKLYVRTRGKMYSFGAAK